VAARPIFYDTETTGIKAERDRIVELAAYDPVRDKTLEVLINPQMSIPAEATAIHKISNEMVADAPTFGEVLPQFIDFCEGDVVLIAHNNDAFDIHFLRHECRRCDAELPSSWRFFDTLKWARRYRPDLPRHTLQSLREVYGFQANNAHRALDDVIVLHQVYVAMTDDLPIDTVYGLLNVPKALKTMPFGKYKGEALDRLPSDYVVWLADSGAFEKAENLELKKALDALGKFKKEKALR
jgi:DNA polymerase III subunit epsilon